MRKVPKSEWTELEREFDRLVSIGTDGRWEFRVYAIVMGDALIAKHGKEAMDAMWERIK